MKKHFIPIFLFVALSLAIGITIVYGLCTVTQTAPSSEREDGIARIPLHFVYGQGQTVDINCDIPLGAGPNYISDFSSNTCNGLEAQAVAVSSAPGVGNIVPPPPSPSTGVVSVGP